MALKLRRGLEADRDGILPAEGELIYTTDQKQLFVGDGVTAGGTLVSSAVVSVNGSNGVVTLTTDDIDEGTNKYFTNTQARNAISVTGSGGTYNPTTGVIDLTGGGAGGATYAISAETTTGGVNLRLTGSDTSTDNVKFAQGSNITLTRTDANTITIASTASSSVQNLNDLIDVEAASPSNGQALVWNSGSSTWTAAAVGSGTVDSGVTNQLAYYTDTFTVAGSTKFVIDTSTGEMFVEGSLHSPNIIIEADSATDSLIMGKYHDTATENTIRINRSRGTRLAPTSLQTDDQLFAINSQGFDGTTYIRSALISATVDSVTETTQNYTATLGAGTAVVTLTSGNTSGLVVGQFLVKTSGTGIFGTYWDGSLACISSINSPTQLTLNVNHYTPGAVVFDVQGIVASRLLLSSGTTDGHNRAHLKIENDGQVWVGPDLADFDGTKFTGKLNVVSMVASEHDYSKAMLRLTSLGTTAQGQEIAFTRTRGTVTQGTNFDVHTVQSGDELGSLAFYGWYDPNPSGTLYESSRIIAEASGTVTGSAIPGKIRLQTADSLGVMRNSLTVDHQQVTTFGGMTKLAAYANEATANTAVGGTPTNGMMYYDSGANVGKMYGNSAWHALW